MGEVLQSDNRRRLWLKPVLVGLFGMAAAGCSGEGSSSTESPAIPVYRAVGSSAFKAIDYIHIEDIKPECMVQGRHDSARAGDAGGHYVEEKDSRQLKVELEDNDEASAGFIYAPPLMQKRNYPVCEVNELILPNYDDVVPSPDGGKALEAEARRLRDTLEDEGNNYLDQQGKLLAIACDDFPQPKDTGKLKLYGDFLAVTIINSNADSVSYGMAMQDNPQVTLRNFCFPQEN